MKKLTTSVSALAAIMALSAGAHASDDDRNSARPAQQNWAEARARLNAEIENVNGSVDATTAAIANSMTASLSGGSYVENLQLNRANVSADSWASIEDVSGAVNVTTAALANSASVTLEDTVGDATVFNRQWTRGNVTADLALEVDNVGWDSEDAEALNATAAAIGNSFSAEVDGGLDYANNYQLFNGNSVAEMYAHIDDVHGDATLTTAAIANSATLDVTSGHGLKFDNFQAAGYDPTAISNIEATDVSGALNSTTAALSNSLSISTLPEVGALDVNSVQLNGAANRATANISLDRITGDVAVTAAAIGNSVNISGLPQ